MRGSAQIRPKQKGIKAYDRNGTKKVQRREQDDKGPERKKIWGRSSAPRGIVEWFRLVDDDIPEPAASKNSCVSWHVIINMTSHPYHVTQMDTGVAESSPDRTVTGRPKGGPDYQVAEG